MAKNQTKKRKIAILINAFWNSGAGISGGDQRVMQIFKRLEEKFEIDIYTSSEGKKVFSQKIKSAKYIISPEKFEKGNVLLRYQRRSNWLTGEITGKKYDVIYSSSDFFPDVTPAYIYKKNNPKVTWISCVFHIYPNWRKRPGNKFINLIGTSIQKESFKKIRLLADRVVNINYQVRNELLKKYRFDNKKIVVNPCGIDLNYFELIKARKKRFQACFLARLVPSKGIFELPEIWSEVVKKIPSAKLKIIGGGSEKVKSKLNEMLESAGISDKVEVMGFLPNDEAYKILKESELFVFPSHEEGFGIAIAEAFACKTAVAAWDLPVYSEVFDSAVLTAEIGNCKKMSQKISSLLKDQKKISQLASLGKDVVKKYSWDQISVEELEIINLKK